MPRVLQEWEDYRRRVLPANAPAVQITECKRAFYAGAWGVLNHILHAAEPGVEPTDADMHMMDEIAAELKAFGVGGGRG